MFKRALSQLTHRIYELPVLVLMPHSRCNCRCVMCDIWKANNDKKELTAEEIGRHIAAFKKLGVKRVALSGGEALMHSNLWRVCEQLKSIGATISLLSTGITLKAHAHEVTQYTDDVIVSLDGSARIHDQIRNIPSAFEKLRESVQAVKKENPLFPVTGRCVLQKLNFRDFPNIINSAQGLGLDQISFLAADVSSSAFNRTEPWEENKIAGIGLDREEAEEFEMIIRDSIHRFRDLYKTKFIAESPEKMLSLATYYKALLGFNSFPTKKCNAPWVSAVVESDGAVRPCFFHKTYGNIYENDFNQIINSREAISFRKNLDMSTDAVCERCVCSLYV